MIKKKILLTLFVAFIATFVSAQIITDADMLLASYKGKLKGKIKTIHLKVSGGVPIIDEYTGDVNSVYTFNEKGKIVENYDSMRYNKFVYKYDTLDNLKSIEVYSFNETLIKKMQFSYSLISTEMDNIDDNGNFQSATVYIKDINGNILEKRNYNTDRKLGTYNLMSYSNNGIVSDEVFYEPNANNNGTVYYSYDYNGNPSEVKAYFSNGNLRYSKNFQFDNYGQNNVAKCYTAEGTLYWWTNLEYRNLDEKGNWTKCNLINGKNGEQKGYVIRKIQYY